MRYLGQDLEPTVITDRLRAEASLGKSLIVLCECERSWREHLVDFLRQAGLTDRDFFRTHDGKLQVKFPPEYLADDELLPIVERLRGFRVAVTSVVPCSQ